MPSIPLSHYSKSQRGKKRHEKCCYRWDYLRHETGRQRGGTVLSCNIWVKNAVYCPLRASKKAGGRGTGGPEGNKRSKDTQNACWIITEAWSDGSNVPNTGYSPNRKLEEEPKGVRGTKTQEASAFSQVGTLSRTCTFSKATGSWRLKKNSWDFPGSPAVKKNAFS